VSTGLEALGTRSVNFRGHSWSLDPLSVAMFYLLGVAGEILLLTSLYLVMPVGRLSVRHALVGGVTAALLWEATRHVLTWYFASVSKVNVVYGSLATAIVVLLSLEIAATLVLFGAQVIAEYERVSTGRGVESPPAASG
jgi:YihY family inner membrane protein